MSSSDQLAFGSLLVALLALIVTVYGVWRANVTAAFAAFISLNEAIRATYQKMIQAENEEVRCYQLAEFMNLLEIGAAAILDGSLWGRPKNLAVSNFKSLLRLLSTPAVSDKLLPLLENERTFEYIREFAKTHKCDIPNCLK